MVLVLNNGRRAVKMFDTVPYFCDTGDCLICEDVRVDTAIFDSLTDNIKSCISINVFFIVKASKLTYIRSLYSTLFHQVNWQQTKNEYNKQKKKMRVARYGH